MYHVIIIQWIICIEGWGCSLIFCFILIYHGAKFCDDKNCIVIYARVLNARDFPLRPNDIVD